MAVHVFEMRREYLGEEFFALRSQLHELTAAIVGEARRRTSFLSVRRSTTPVSVPLVISVFSPRSLQLMPAVLPSVANDVELRRGQIQRPDVPCGNVSNAW